MLFNIQLLLRNLQRVGLLLILGMTGHAYSQPNIIHIVADDLGWTDIGSGLTNYGNGSTFYQTPTLAQLASEGMSFTSAYAMPTCAPTRVAIMTGQSGARTGSYSVTSIEGDANDLLVGAANLRQIPTSLTTLAETLQAAGYTTAHLGKFHVADSENDIINEHGFDFNYGGSTTGAPGSFFPNQNGGNWTYPNPVSTSLDVYAAPYTQSYIDNNLKPYANGADVDSLVGTPKHLTDATTDAAIDFLSGHMGSSEPFYMNLAYHAVHTPIESRPDLEAKYNHIISNNGGTSPDPRHDNAAYAGLLEGMDQSIARIVDYLEDPNGDGNTADSISDNTLIMFYGDNGGSSQGTDNSPLNSTKSSHYEGGTRVPLIAWMPGTISAGTSSDEPIQPIDFFPTFAEMAGADLPNPQTQPLDGMSLVGLLEGTQDQLDREGAFLHHPGYVNQVPGPLSSVVLDAGDTRYKLAYLYEDRSFEVFDLRNDLLEANNLADGNMSTLDYKMAVRAVVALRGWLDDSGAVYPTVRADGSSVPAPDHTPESTFQLGQSSGINLDGLSSISLDMHGITLNLEAGGLNATFDAALEGIGIASDLDGGNVNQAQRINGMFSTPESVEFSFDEDVYLKSLLLGSLNINNTETVLIEFISGDNPFTNLTGYDAASGFSLGADSLSIDPVGNGMEYLLEFGLLSQDEIFLTAGTVISVTANPAVGGGFLLNEISVARPLSAIDTILNDYNLDGVISLADYDVWVTTYGSTTDLRADGNGDGVVNAADYTIWRDLFEQQSISTGLISATQAVPEPTSLALLSLGLLLVKRSRADRI